MIHIHSDSDIGQLTPTQDRAVHHGRHQTYFTPPFVISRESASTKTLARVFGCLARVFGSLARVFVLAKSLARVFARAFPLPSQVKYGAAAATSKEVCILLLYLAFAIALGDLRGFGRNCSQAQPSNMRPRNGVDDVVPVRQI
jgi:hypothetical protein